MRNIVIFMIIFVLIFSGCGLSQKTNGPGDGGNHHMDQDKEDAPNRNSERDSAKSTPTSVSEGSREEDDATMRYTTFYYQDEEGLLIPVTRKIARVEGIGKAAINGLVDIPVIREDVGRVGVYPVLPGEMHINGMTIRDGIAVLDVNEHILDYKAEQNERNILNAIVYTLTEFDTIEGVQLLINGEKYDTLRFGSPIHSPQKRKGINSFNEDSIDDDKEEIEIYFTKLVNNQYMYYVPVTQAIDNPTGDMDRYMKTVNELIKGDVGNTKLKSYVPANTKLKGIQVYGQTVILDFNDAILNATDSNTSFDIMLKQMLLCFKQFGKIKSVKITVNGSPLKLPGLNAGQNALEVPVFANQF